MCYIILNSARLNFFPSPPLHLSDMTHENTSLICNCFGKMLSLCITATYNSSDGGYADSELCSSCSPHQRELCIYVDAPSSDAWSHPKMRALLPWGASDKLDSHCTHLLTRSPSPPKWKIIRRISSLLQVGEACTSQDDMVIHHGKSLLSSGRPATCKGEWHYIPTNIHQSVHPFLHLCLPWTKSLRDPGKGGHVSGEGHWRTVIHFVSLPFLKSSISSALITITFAMS